MIEYTAASYHFERAEHKCYLANVEIQLGNLSFTINRCEEAHEHLDRARRIHANLRDAGIVAQIDEIRASVFLKQGRIREAERAARAAVYSQEKTGKHALLAETLITHGRALARLNRYGAALFSFRRAFDLSEHTGDTSRAADAALAGFQEIGEHLAVAERGHHIPGGSLSKAKRALEHDLIERALESAEGSVVHAAAALACRFKR